jgi:hypothetical protein
VELDKEQESGKKTGKVINKPELGRELCYLYQNPVSPLMEAHGWSERDVVSRIQFSRPTSSFFSDLCTVGYLFILFACARTKEKFESVVTRITGTGIMIPVGVCCGLGATNPSLLAFLLYVFVTTVRLL